MAEFQGNPTRFHGETILDSTMPLLLSLSTRNFYAFSSFSCIFDRSVYENVFREFRLQMKGGKWGRKKEESLLRGLSFIIIIF